MTPVVVLRIPAAQRILAAQRQDKEFSAYRELPLRPFRRNPAWAHWDAPGCVRPLDSQNEVW